MEKRKIELLKDGKWVPFLEGFIGLKPNYIVRFLEENGELVVGKGGKTSFIVRSYPFLNDNGILTVHADETDVK